MTIPDEQIRGYFATSFSTVSGTPARFIFYMDEMGRQGQAGEQEMVCFVPVNFDGPFVYCPAPRRGKSLILIACIAVDGNFIGPCIVIARKTFDAELLVHGFTPEKVEIYSQTKSSIDIDILMIGYAAHFGLKFLLGGIGFHMKDWYF
jgi:hypothetical protein